MKARELDWKRLQQADDSAAAMLPELSPLELLQARLFASTEWMRGLNSRGVRELAAERRMTARTLKAIIGDIQRYAVVLDRVREHGLKQDTPAMRSVYTSGSRYRMREAAKLHSDAARVLAYLAAVDQQPLELGAQMQGAGRPCGPVTTVEAGELEQAHGVRISDVPGDEAKQHEVVASVASMMHAELLTRGIDVRLPFTAFFVYRLDRWDDGKQKIAVEFRQVGFGLPSLPAPDGVGL